MAPSTPETKAVWEELFNLLVIAHVYSSTWHRFAPPENSDYGHFAYRIHLRAMEHEVVVGLCRLDDDKSSLHSLRQTLKSVRTDIPHMEAERADKKLTAFRRDIGDIKVARRNGYLAHRPKGKVSNYEPKGDFMPHLVAACEIFDIILQETVSFRFHLGKSTHEYNLRDALK